MSIGSAVLLGLVVLTLVYGVVIYNGLVQLKHNLAKAWANIDVLLKQRHDELPKLVEVCRQYKQFEQDTLARVTEARARVAQARETHDVPALGAAEQLLRSGLGQIFAVAEAYPELRANEHFMQLQSRITALENDAGTRWRAVFSKRYLGFGDCRDGSVRDHRRNRKHRRRVVVLEAQSVSGDLAA